MLLARISPISWMFVNSSTEAFIRLSILLYFLASTLAVLAPIPGIPIANSSLSKEFSLLSSIDLSKLSTLLLPNPSSSIRSSLFSFKE